MSYTSTVGIEFAASQANAMDAIQTLLDNGWTVNDHGAITYLPIGGNECYNWQRAPLDSWRDLQKTLGEKIVKGESVGIVLTWRDTAVGGDFHFAPDIQRLSVGWSVNRKTVAGGFTDHSWYLAKVLPPLVASGLTVEVFRCVDSP